MDFRILGPLEVVSGGRTLDLGGEKQRALLAALLLEPNRVVSRDRLVDVLWDDAPPATAQKALQVHVSQLRKLLGADRVVTKAPGYLLAIEPDELDAACFRRLHGEGRLHEALTVWTGPALADLAHLRFLYGEAALLEEERLACLEERVESDVVQGADAELVG